MEEQQTLFLRNLKDFILNPDATTIGNNVIYFYYNLIDLATRNIDNDVFKQFVKEQLQYGKTFRMFDGTFHVLIRLLNQAGQGASMSVLHPEQFPGLRIKIAEILNIPMAELGDPANEGRRWEIDYETYEELTQEAQELAQEAEQPPQTDSPQISYEAAADFLGSLHQQHRSQQTQREVEITRRGLVRQRASDFDQHRCAICLDDFDATSRISIVDSCGHKFDKSCINMWRTRHGYINPTKVCPICKGAIDRLLGGSKKSKQKNKRKRKRKRSKKRKTIKGGNRKKLSLKNRRRTTNIKIKSKKNIKRSNRKRKQK